MGAVAAEKRLPPSLGRLSAPRTTAPAVRNKKRSNPMCDYSLHHVANRPAKIEDKLVATKFHNSITRGFAAVGQPNVGVCPLPGTKIAFDESGECEPPLGICILPDKKVRQGLARVRQIRMEH